MKTKTMVLCCLIGAAVSLMSYENSTAKSKADSRASLQKQDKGVVNIGVVDVRRVFRDCKRNAKYGAEVMAEESKSEAEREKLSREIDSQKTGLNALKLGSSDYLAQIKELLQKQADLEAARQFNSQQRTLKDQRWTEELYMEVLKIVNKLAEEKQLDMVLQKDVVEFPSGSPDELMMTLSTHKLMYCGGCVDITDEVRAQLDTEQKD
jgi:Skp family chaperone for outer membrane proteins